MSLSKQEFTNGGRAMLGAAQAGATLTITKIVVGSGAASLPSDLWPLTALITHELDVNISSKRDLGGGIMMVEGNFRSTDAPHPFYLREVGIMAYTSTGGGGSLSARAPSISDAPAPKPLVPADALYSVANVLTDPPDYIDPAAPTVQSFKIKLIIDRVDPSDIVVEIGPSEAILGENVGDATVGPGPFKEADGNILKFKRFIAGDGIELNEAPAPEDGADTIEIRARQLKTNVDLYVPLTYPGITDPTVLFPTVQAAHDYLLQFHIPPDKLARIHVYSGHFANTIPINFSHPDSSFIQVIGQDPIVKTLRAGINITRSGTLPNIDVVVPVASTAGIAVGDVVYLHDAPHAQLEGCGYVTAISANVTVRMSIYNVLPPSTIAPLSTTRLLVFPTQFTSTLSGQTPIFNFLNGINLLKNFGCKAATQYQGMAATVLGGQMGEYQNVIAVNFSVGLGVAGPMRLTPVVAANGCQVGLEIGPQGITYLQAPNPTGGWPRVTWSGNQVYGLWVVGGSYVTGNNSTAGSYTYACSNGGTGIRSDTKAWVGIANGLGPTGGYVIGWNDIGCHAALLAIIQSALQVQSAIVNNVTWDLMADTGSQVGLVYNVTMSGLYSPALDVLGPSGGYIHIGALNPP